MAGIKTRKLSESCEEWEGEGDVGQGFFVERATRN